MLQRNITPTLRVGLMSAPEVDINFLSGFENLGQRHFNIAQLDSPVMFTPTGTESVFEVSGVTIGVGFHWEQQQRQRFNGAVELLPDGDSIVVINHVDVEQYLRSVISSEMSPDSPAEFLKAHAVISRSWVIRQIMNRTDKGAVAPDSGHDITAEHGSQECSSGCDEIIRWYDREDHRLFDVCADDHCERYQGVTRITSATAAEAVDATRGMVLMDGDSVCDARFSKCCGGVTEEFATCWGEESHPYIKAFRDTVPEGKLPDLTTEEGAAEWILSRPEAFCNTDDADLLSKVLNNFDRATTDFYRWTVTATGDELADIIRQKSGIDIGSVIDLTPMQRGKSGRLCKLKITGSKRSIIVGKELEIRRLLSPSHLYSSAFIIEKSVKTMGNDKKITTFTLRGAGWGHGVGLCQIGAAAMSAEGYDYKAILNHYYPGADITKIYE